MNKHFNVNEIEALPMITGAMESRDHSKNEANLKSHMSRRNFFRKGGKNV
jgi:hypothetical protein